MEKDVILFEKCYTVVQFMEICSRLSKRCELLRAFVSNTENDKQKRWKAAKVVVKYYPVYAYLRESVKYVQIMNNISKKSEIDRVDAAIQAMKAQMILEKLKAE